MSKMLRIFCLLPILVLAGCGGVTITPTSPEVPQPLIVPFPVDVGISYDEAFRQYTHQEERWGSRWEVQLGKSHLTMLENLMDLAFGRVVEVQDPKAPPADAALGIVFQPHIDRYSFITPRDAGGEFFAVTIKYRFEVFTPDGRPADTLTFTGYGGAPAKGFSSGKPLIAATQVAMRDAMAKFLVQFPDQKVARRLRAGEPLIEERAPGAEEEIEIEPVPIFPQANSSNTHES